MKRIFIEVSDVPDDIADGVLLALFEDPKLVNATGRVEDQTPAGDVRLEKIAETSALLEAGKYLEAIGTVFQIIDLVHPLPTTEQANGAWQAPPDETLKEY